MRTLNEARWTHSSGKDKIRKALSPEYHPKEQFYPRRENIHHGMEHIPVVNLANIPAGHCMEQIRQYIMCAGDLTPIPTRYMEGIYNNYVDSDVVHMCRDWDPIRQWARSHKTGPNAVSPIFTE
jgi:hypothetical protein